MNRGAEDERAQWVMKRVEGSGDKGGCRTIVRQAAIMNRGAEDERAQWVMKRVEGSVDKGGCRTIVRQSTIMNRGRWREANEVYYPIRMPLPILLPRNRI